MLDASCQLVSCCFRVIDWDNIDPLSPDDGPFLVKRM